MGIGIKTEWMSVCLISDCENSSGCSWKNCIRFFYFLPSGAIFLILYSDIFILIVLNMIHSPITKFRKLPRHLYIYSSVMFIVRKKMLRKVFSGKMIQRIDRGNCSVSVCWYLYSNSTTICCSTLHLYICCY